MAVWFGNGSDCFVNEPKALGSDAPLACTAATKESVSSQARSRYLKR